VFNKELLTYLAQLCDVMVFTELESDLESFLVRERIKIQDECSRQAVNKVIGTSSGKKDRLQQMIDSWTSAFQQVRWVYVFLCRMAWPTHCLQFVADKICDFNSLQLSTKSTEDTHNAMLTLTNLLLLYYAPRVKKTYIYFIVLWWKCSDT